MKISGFEWDEYNVLHLTLKHGIEPYEAEEVFACEPLFRKTKRGHYSALGPTLQGRHLAIIFELKNSGVGRVITGWDMKTSERKYYRRETGR